jgi:hypothetical protein
VGTANGDVTLQVWIDRRVQEVPIPGIVSRPAMVILDEPNAVLKELTFDQPATWLATQLGRDASLWNRDWVIGQLAARPESAEALAALVSAARGADYYHTRARAALALARFPGEEASRALVTALRDTSAQVRAAAAQALGERGEAGVTGALRARWMGDSSEAVRAQALGALARLAPAEARSLILEGLASSTYLDVVAEAATQAAIERADTTLLDDLDLAAGRVRLAMLALGVFGSRGSDRALDLLDGHLLSDRATLRRRALETYQAVVPDSLARVRLAAIKPAIRDESARRQIEELLGRSGQ